VSFLERKKMEWQLDQHAWLGDTTAAADEKKDPRYQHLHLFKQQKEVCVSCWLVNHGNCEDTAVIEAAFYGLGKILIARSIPHSYCTTTEVPRRPHLCIKFYDYRKVLGLFAEYYPTLSSTQVRPLPKELLTAIEQYQQHMQASLDNNHLHKSLHIQFVFQHLVDCMQNEKENKKEKEIPQTVLLCVFQYAYGGWYESCMPHIWKLAKEHQKIGLDFIVSRNACALLADGMGLGKTLQAIMATLVYRTSRPCIIICLRSLMHGWKQSLLRWNSCLPVSEIFCVETQKMFKRWFDQLKHQQHIPQYFLMSFEMARLLQDDLLKIPFKFLIIDESHNCKNLDTMRTLCLTKLAANHIPHRLLMTGTPASKPKEIYTQWIIINPKIPPRYDLHPPNITVTNFLILLKKNCDNDEDFQTKILPRCGVSFLKRWCKPFLNVTYVKGRKLCTIIDTGAERLNELYVLLSLTCTLHRTQEVLGDETPQVSRTKIIFPCSSAHRKQYEESMNALKKLPKGDSRSKFIYMKQYNDIPSIKIKFCLKFLRVMLNASLSQAQENEKEEVTTIRERFRDRKFIIYAHNRDFIKALQDMLVEQHIVFGLIDGKTDVADRSLAEDTFQTDPNCRVIVISLLAGGTGLNLQAGSVVVFCQMGWSPDLMLQAEGRAARLGQTRLVECFYLVAEPCIEQMILRVYQKKNFNSGMILTGVPRHVPFHYKADLTSMQKDIELQQGILDLLSFQENDPISNDDVDNVEQQQQQEVEPQVLRELTLLEAEQNSFDAT